MKGITKHILIIFALAGAISLYLFSYKLRHYDTAGFMADLAVNVGLWMFLLSAPYFVIFSIIKLAVKSSFTDIMKAAVSHADKKSATKKRA